jgi:hypothetical protein
MLVGFIAPEYTWDNGTPEFTLNIRITATAEA